MHDSTDPGPRSGDERHMGHGTPPSEPGHGVHDKHAGHDPALFRDRFWLLPLQVDLSKHPRHLNVQEVPIPGVERLMKMVGEPRRRSTGEPMDASDEAARHSMWVRGPSSPLSSA